MDTCLQANNPNPKDPVFLFLDFDGVLHRFFPIQGEDEAMGKHFAFLPAFEDAVRACTREIKIVISSTWRRKYDLEQLRAMFSPDIALMVVGTTPRIDGGNEPYGRLAEAQAWLKDNGYRYSPWVGVDDYPVLYGEGAVVACHDGFFQRERDLLLQAVADPEGFAKQYPCDKEGMKRAIRLST